MTTMPIDRVIARLQGNGRSRSQFICPTHADKHPSLSVKEAEDGRVLMHCFAGCETQAVLGAIGLKFRDLFPSGR